MSSTLESLKEQFMSSSTDEKRIEFARKYIMFSTINTTNNSINNSSDKLTFKSNLHRKNDEVKIELYSTKLYEEGDCFFNDCLFDKAIISYTHSLSAAPLNLLGLIYAKRSAVLESMGKLMECLTDIECADQFGYPDTLQTKLKLRQAKCYKLLTVNTAQNFEQIIDVSSPMEIKLDDTIKNPRLEINCEERNKYSHIPTICIKNKYIPCASEAVNVAYNNIFGKHIIAARDIEPGEVLIVEEAFAAVLSQKCWWTHCSHCLHRSFNLQPCPNCSWAMFCSNQCQQKARTYHNIECGVVTKYMKLNGDVDTCELLTIRIIATTGFDSLLDMLFTKDDKKIQCNNSTSSIFDLISHDLLRSFEEMLEACCIACDIVKCSKLACEMSVLDQLTGLILRIFLCRDSNAHALIEQISNSKNLKASNLGSGIFIISSLVNHSCDPNVFRINFCNTLVHRASRYIKKGTQIMISYGVQFDRTSKLERQKYLKKYYFDCSCMACIDCWPLKENLPKEPIFNLQEKDDEKRYLELIRDKEKILSEEAPRADQELLVVNKNLLELFYKNKKFLNQVYIEVEYEFKYFYRMRSAVSTF